MKQLLISVVFLLLPLQINAETLNAGFVQGIWYSDDPVLADTPTRIYVALRNNTEHDLSGTVRFTDNGKRIGTSEVRALSGRLVEAWVDWTPDFGTHSISATVSDAKLHIIGDGTEPVDIEGMVAESIIFVDRDNDKDGIGDAKDDDDDNDTIPDDEEVEKGSDPLDATSVPEEDSEENEPEYQDDDNREDTASNESDTESEAPPVKRDGLERFIAQEPANSILAGFTETIHEKKEDLDTYRSSRVVLGSDSPSLNPPQSQSLSQPGTSTETQISRTKTEPKKGIFEQIIDGFVLLFFHLWSFVLWIVSGLLSFPALIEIIGLILFLYVLFRIMRRMARRQQQ